MKTLSHISLTGPRGERGWGMLPHPRPRLPVGGELFPIYIPMGEETSPSPSPNRGIPRGESGIGSPLPSLAAAMARVVGVEDGHISRAGFTAYFTAKTARTRRGTAWKRRPPGTECPGCNPPTTQELSPTHIKTTYHNHTTTARSAST
jgi:hypothetical protein